MAYSKIFRYSPQNFTGSATLFRKGKNSDMTLSVMTKFDCNSINRFPLHNPSPEEIPDEIEADRQLENNTINQLQIQLT